MKKGIIGALSALIGAGAGAVAVEKILGSKVNIEKELSNKHLTLFLMMNQWVKIKQEGKNLSEYFEKNNYKKIAIYGMSYAGETLVDELKNGDIKIQYGIDKRADNIYADFKIISPEENLETVDAVVVTSVTYFDEIEDVLSKKLNCPIISLEDILYEV